jgi:predicted CoA-substrate-specific enzyme activase
LAGDSLKAVSSLLDEIWSVVPYERITGARVCGSGANLVTSEFGVPQDNEFRALAWGVGTIHPEVVTVFEMGGQTSKFIRLDVDAEAGTVGIESYERNGDCAAGTGSFIDQQSSRLQYAIEDVGQIVDDADVAPTIAGRCSVFAKSDMVHAQQKGYQPPEILKGLCEAVARNFKGAITKGKKIEAPTAFLGGVAANTGVVEAIREAFKLGADELIVPEMYAWLGAVGTAILELQAVDHVRPTPKGSDSANVADPPAQTKLSMDNVTVLRDRAESYSFEDNEVPVDAYMGIDIGSVSTNLVVIDTDGRVIHEIYTRTNSRPIQVVNEGLKEIEESIGHALNIKGVGTTGSGRELIGNLIGADTINDEITAHKRGAAFVGETIIDRQVDTIFEIGGQDSKFISLQDGVVVDFAMNEACAAGTGSFLEEQAEKLGVEIKGQFADLALGSETPLMLGERCTVFMEQDVVHWMQRGATTPDIVAGLAYSVVLNYLNRVVRGRHIGNCVFFQGGTAYNDAVAAAFSQVLDKEIIVPPHNGVMGAIGVALLALDKSKFRSAPSTFRGWSVDSVDYTLREFTCKACSNFCDMQEFIVEDERTYWGDKCSHQFRKRPKVDSVPIIPDLCEQRMDWLLDGFDESRGDGPVIGMPRAMYNYERFPFWRTYLETIGARIVLSETTSKQIVHAGVEATVAEPCFPIRLAHGHVSDLLDKNVDYVWAPNTMDAETEAPEVGSVLCLWGQTLPFVLRQSPSLAHGQYLTPKVNFRSGQETVETQLLSTSKLLGASKSLHMDAVEAAYQAQRAFEVKCEEAGTRALGSLEASQAKGIVLAGRPYNIYDSGANLNVTSKLRDLYGINVIPMDLLMLASYDVSAVNDNMFWNYGRKILQAGMLVGENPNLDLIYITNFKCGPDSYIKQFVRPAAGKPFLVLQFDGHANDAGMLTRCEAYLDSKGFFQGDSRNTVDSVLELV